MKKSSIPAICIWVLYGLAAGVCLFLVSMSAGSALGFGAVPGLAAGLLVMLVLGLSVRGIHGAVQKLPGTVSGEKGRLVSAIWESLLLIACLVGMVALRFALSWDVSADPVFETAKVTGEAFAPSVPHRGMELYLWLLHGAMLLLGNKPLAAAALQTVLLVCAALGLYAGVRRLCGVVPALVTVVFVGFAPYMLAETEKLTPLLLFLIFYGIAVGFIAALPERARETRGISGGVLAVLHNLLTGILIGFCCYLDAAGITLLILLTGVLCVFSLENEERKSILGNGAFVFVCCVLAAAAGFAASPGLRSLGGGSLAESVCAQRELYLPGEFHIPVTTGTGGAFWDVPVLVLLMAVGVFGFWCSRKIRDRALWLGAAVLLVLMQCFGMTCTDYFNAYALLYLFCVIMGGCSVADLFAAGEPQEAAGTDSGVDWLSEAAGTDSEEDARLSAEVDDQSGQTQREQPEDGSNENRLEMIDLQSESAPAVHFIENPLPLPKKKERRVLDYDYEVADDDDFDIQ